MKLNELVLDKVEANFSEAVLEVIDFRGERTLVIEPDSLLDICRLLRDDETLRFERLSDIVGDDMLPDYPRFAVSYHLHSLSNNYRCRLRVPVEDPDDGPETLVSVWPIATWLEMEVHDLFGIRFKGNEDLRRLFLPEDWQGYPLRKDFPLGYEEVQFSFNWQAINAKKPYASKK